MISDEDLEQLIREVSRLRGMAEKLRELRNSWVPCCDREWLGQSFVDDLDLLIKEIEEGNS